MIRMRNFVAVAVAVLSLGLSACGGEQLSNKAVSEVQSASGASTVCPASIRWVYPRVSNLNYQVLSFARSNLGRQVGNGECADLPNQALIKARAKTFYNLGPTGLNADYVWGNLRFTATSGRNILSTATIVPGDVLQLRNAFFKWYPTPNSWQTSTATHHTAVVEAVSEDGQSLCVLEQNSSNRRYVTYGYYKMSGLQSGTVWFYQPTF